MSSPHMALQLDPGAGRAGHSSSHKKGGAAGEGRHPAPSPAAQRLSSGHAHPGGQVLLHLRQRPPLATAMGGQLWHPQRRQHLLPAQRPLRRTLGQPVDYRPEPQRWQILRSGERFDG